MDAVEVPASSMGIPSKMQEQLLSSMKEDEGGILLKSNRGERFSVFRKDEQGRFVFANQRFCEVMDRRLEELVGRTDQAFYPATIFVLRCLSGFSSWGGSDTGNDRVNLVGQHGSAGTHYLVWL